MQGGNGSSGFTKETPNVHARLELRKGTDTRATS